MYGNNFYNPYMYGRYTGNFMNAANIGRTGTNIGRVGFFSNLFHKFNLSGFLNGANKTLNVVNQAIPIYYQVKPMISNAKTMFRVMSAVKSDDSKSTSTTNKTIKQATKTNTTASTNISSDGSPTFFI